MDPFKTSDIGRAVNNSRIYSEQKII